MIITQYQMVLRKDVGRSYLRKHRDIVMEDSLCCCSTPSVVYNFIEKAVNITELAEEEVYIIGLNSKSKVLGLFCVSHGTVNSSILSPREVFQRALLIGATNIIVIHNHPSQDTTPSSEDKSITRRINDAGKLIGVGLLDHIIVGNGYYSFKESGQL